MIRDFPKLQISETHWLDVRCCFKDGKFNPNHVLEIFAKYSDMEVDDLWECALNLVLPMKAIDFKTWLLMMRIPICVVDELMLFILCKIHDHHAMVFTDSKLWSTFEEGHQLSLDELYNICDIHLLYLGQDMYGELKSLYGENRISTISTPSSLLKTVVAGKTLSSVPMLTKLCQEELKQIGTQNHVQSSCTPLLKPAMENYLSDHPHLLKALGLTKSLPTNDTSTEVNLQLDLDINDSSDKAEDPELGKTPPSTGKLDHAKNDQTSSKSETQCNELDLPVLATEPENLQPANTGKMDKSGSNTEADTLANGTNLQVDTHSSNDKNDDVSPDFLIALTLQKKVCVNVSVEEADLLCKKTEIKTENQHGLYFEKIGGRILRPRKCTYYATRSRRNSTNSIFYRGQCEDSTPRKWTKDQAE